MEKVRHSDPDDFIPRNAWRILRSAFRPRSLACGLPAPCRRHRWAGRMTWREGPGGRAAPPPLVILSPRRGPGNPHADPM